MKTTLHITSGDMAGRLLEKSDIPGEVFVWHDILYNGPRNPGWPDEKTLAARAVFLEETTGGGLDRLYILETLNAQYEKLKSAAHYESLVLWFDACLFDQSMLCHILTCLGILENLKADLLCIDAFPGINPYHGIGQLSPDQLASVYPRRGALTAGHFLFAERVDRAFALQDQAEFLALKELTDAPLPWVAAAAGRWLEEYPDQTTGLGRLECLALEAIRSGCRAPKEILSFVSERETPPQFWGDITLWEKINALADRDPSLVRIEGPGPRLPQWEGTQDLTRFRICPAAGRK